MSKGGAKALRQEKARKKAKRNKILIICGCILVVAVLSALIVNSIMRQAGAETYSGGGQTVYLFSDGKFTAYLAHSVTKSGTYTKSTADGITTVSFNIGGKVEVGTIRDGALHIPAEWDDGHGHGSVLRKT